MTGIEELTPGLSLDYNLAPPRVPSLTTLDSSPGSTSFEKLLTHSTSPISVVSSLVEEISGPIPRPVPSITSSIFNPLYIAVFNQKRLRRETIISCDLVRLCQELVRVAQAVPKSFNLIGYYLKGIYIIFLQRLKFMSADIAALGKAIDAMMKPEVEPSTVADEERVRRKPGKRPKPRKPKRADADVVLALEDEYKRANTDVIPVERMEMLQMMNLGIGMGLGTDLAFYGRDFDNFNPMSDDSALFLRSVQPGWGESTDEAAKTRNWINFEDLSLSRSPFHLNAYSYTPHDSTTFTDLASVSNFNDSEISTDYTSVGNRYHLDYCLYNDPLEFESDQDGQEVEREVLVPRGGSRARKTRLYDATICLPITAKRRKPTRNPRNPPSPNPKQSPQTYRNPTIAELLTTTKMNQDTREELKAHTSLRTDLVSVDCSRKAATLNEALACFEKRVMSNPSIITRSLYNIAEQPTIQIRPIVPNPGSTQQANAGSNLGPKSGPKPGDKQVDKSADKTGDKLAPRQSEETQKAFDKTLESFNGPGGKITTEMVLNAYRDVVRGMEEGRIEFNEICRNKDRHKTSVIFYRTLLLANSNFVMLERVGSEGVWSIEVRPGRRFWEPIQFRRARS